MKNFVFLCFRDKRDSYKNKKGQEAFLLTLLKIRQKMLFNRLLTRLPGNPQYRLLL